MKIINLIVIILFNCNFIFCQSISADIINKIKKATVYIEVVHEHRPYEYKYEPVSSGSGFFISENGYLVTNYHVVQSDFSMEDAVYIVPTKEIKVTLNSGTSEYKKYSAKIIFVDKVNDLAILRIKDAVKTPFVEVCKDDNLVESSPVWAFGFPYGEAFSVIQRGPEITVSNGSITSLRHNDRDVLDKIQFDAVVKNGSSGGPLVNAKGEVIGIVYSIMYKESGMNFAIPSYFLRSLMSKIPLDNASSGDIMFSFSSSPSSASVFVDYDYKGLTPLNNLKEEQGIHTIVLMKNGCESFIEEIPFVKDSLLKVDLSPVKNLEVNMGGKQTNDNVDKNSLNNFINAITWSSDDILLFEDFNDENKFNKWEQSTGGEDRRTWYIEDGILYQHESDELLHSISLGDSSWSNYEIRAKLRITNETNDSRAGIIFRDNKDGFYLFRIHRESNKAQLSYHSKNPFGWFVLKEEKFDFDITDDWYKVDIIVSDDNIICYLNSKQVFAFRSGYSSSGRVGLYSVESKASFDSLYVYKFVYKLPDNIFENKKASYCNPISFWFSDYFNYKSLSWYQYTNESKEPSVWYYSDYGCALLAKDNKIHYNEFTKYQLSDFKISFMLSVAKAEKDSRFEFYFRKNENGYYSFRFLKDKVQLIYNTNNEEKILKEKNSSHGFYEDIQYVYITVDGDHLSCSQGLDVLIEYDNKKLNTNSGTFGFSSLNLPVTLYEMMVTSIQKE